MKKKDGNSVRLVYTSLRKLITLLFNNLTKKIPENPDAFLRLLARTESEYAMRFYSLGNKLDINLMNAIMPSIDRKFRRLLNVKFSLSDPGKVREKVKTSGIYDLINLIKSIPLDAIEKIREPLVNDIASYDRNAIIKKLQSVHSMTRRRAYLIARDQVSKVQEVYTRELALELNIVYFEWSTSRDGRVSKGRGGHQELDGKIYSYLNPTAVIDRKGNTGIPGQRVNCRCVALPLEISPDKLRFKIDPLHGNYYMKA